MKELRILLIGGGSGGHVYPLIAVARSLKQKLDASGINLNLMMLGGSFIDKAAKESNIKYKIISTGKLRTYSSSENFFDIARFFIGLFQSFWHIFLFMPDIVFSKGGAASVPPALIAKLFFIPLYIHESDSVPGLANSLVGKVSEKIFLSFKTAEKFFNLNKVVFTGNPTRIFQGDKNVAREYFNLHEPRPTILIIGGSQGAKVINEVITSSLVVMAQKFNIIHQCGETQFESVKKDVDTILKEGTQQYSVPVKAYYRFYPYFDENQLGLAYSMADIIISRAGAASLFEIAQLGKPAIVIPITQSRGNHQYLNAFEFSLAGGYLLEESNLNRESLIREIDILLNPENYARISQKIRLFATPNAADKIAEEVFRALGVR